MAIIPLSLAESLRPWRAAGITCFLAEPGSGGSLLPGVQDREYGLAPEIARVPSPDASDAAPARPGVCLSDDQGVAMPPPTRTHAPSRPVAPVSLAEKPFGREGTGSHQGDSIGRNGQKRGSPTREAESLANGLEWPEAWQVLLARTRPAPIVWTYAELGQDLTGNGDKERAVCLRRIIASLQLPKGSSAFWPVCLAPFIEEAPPLSAPDDGADSLPGASGAPFSGMDGPTDSDEARFFQAGLQRLSPKVVIMLGIQALILSGLDVSMRIPFTQQVHKGTLFVLLPDFSTLLSKTSLQERAGVFLCAALSGLPLS